MKKNFTIHHSSEVDDNVSIGNGTKIWHFSHILKNSVIGENCVIGQNVSIGPNVSIGSNVKIQNNVSIYDGITIEDDVFCGPSCVFTNVINPRAFIERKDEFKPTIVKTGASIGANATIVCGIKIGRYSLIGAGSVVTKNVMDYSIVVGNPSRPHGFICKCGIKLTKTLKCKSCNQAYKWDSNMASLKEVSSVKIEK